MALLKSWGFQSIEEFALFSRPSRQCLSKCLETERLRKWRIWEVRANLLRWSPELQREVRFWRRLHRNKLQILRNQLRRMSLAASRGEWVNGLRIGSYKTVWGCGVGATCRIKRPGHAFTITELKMFTEPFQVSGVFDREQLSRSRKVKRISRLGLPCRYYDSFRKL